MNSLSSKQCKPCENGTRPLDRQRCRHHLDAVPGWQLSADGKSIGRKFQFKNFAATMAFIRQLADIADNEDHHPDFCAGYNYCDVKFTTHDIDGLSENDFICAAKINAFQDS